MLPTEGVRDAWGVMERSREIAGCRNGRIVFGSVPGALEMTTFGGDMYPDGDTDEDPDGSEDKSDGCVEQWLQYSKHCRRVVTRTLASSSIAASYLSFSSIS